MRERSKILENLESAYRSAFSRAESAEDEDGMARLDFDYQRDQLFLEAILDVRDGLQTPEGRGDDGGSRVESLLKKAERLRRLTRLR